MNPLHPEKWPRLAAAARGASDPRDVAAPYGFATRVASLALAQERTLGDLLERFSWRALWVACLLTVASTALNYSLFSNSSPDEETLTDDGTVSALLDLSS